MESPGVGDSGHLDATGDRDVVFCHNCSNEWFRDEHGLECPRCDSDITEIVSTENDPRNFDASSGATTPDRAGPAHYGDSDPDEADIEEHMEGDHGFAFHRDTRQGQGRNHHQPIIEPVIHRFFDMIQDFGGADGQPNPSRQFPNEPDHSHHLYHPHPYLHDEPDLTRDHATEHEPDIGGGIQLPFARTFNRGHYRATYRSSPYGTASVTIFAGPVRGGAGGPGAAGGPGGSPSMDGRGDPFQEIFANVMRDIGPPDDRRPDGPSPHFLRGLQDILGLLNPANAMAGDAVYSQEALDRIISQLMEVNPTSSAAPPASEEALNKLERRSVDKEMLGSDSKTECSICIDDLKEGEKAAFLPCKHFFHEACVVLWLKEHNTCPICRTPIEKNEQPNNARRRDRSGPGPAGDNSSHMPHATASGPNLASPNDPNPAESSSGIGRWLFGARPDRSSNPPTGNSSEVGSPSPAVFSGASTPGQVPRPPSRRHTRLNEALRSVSSMQERQRDRDRDTDRDTDQGTSSAVSYDTSRMQRRNSLSPTSPRAFGFGEQSTRFRQRSPSQSARDTQRSQAGGGPITWLRGRFSGGGSNGPPRDERQP